MAGQDDVTRESFNHREGAKFGLAQSVGVANLPAWKWYVPVANQLKIAAGLALPSANLGVSLDWLNSQWQDNRDVNLFDFTNLLATHPELLAPFLERLRMEGPGYDGIKHLPSR